MHRITKVLSGTEGYLKEVFYRKELLYGILIKANGIKFNLLHSVVKKLKSKMCHISGLLHRYPKTSDLEQHSNLMIKSVKFTLKPQLNSFHYLNASYLIIYD